MTELTTAITHFWDYASASFDKEPDHGLRESNTRDAWARLLTAWLPAASCDVLDVGCGTGSLALLLAEAGHRVTGVDISPGMINQSRRKFDTAGLPGQFVVGDAAKPPTGTAQFDVVVCRHLLWTLPDPEAALREWIGRVRPGGRLLLIEGRWCPTGQQGAPYVPGGEALPWDGGVSADDLVNAVRPLARSLRLEPLSDTPALWGRAVTDERFALLAQI